MTLVTVVSLTDAGQALANRLRPHLAQAEFLHRPQRFKATVQDRFRRGHRLILIGAAGIAVRILAPVLQDKHRDPAVLVLDEQGRFIIPLLSGHEGGANAWACRLSEQLGAHCVITGAQSYTHPVLVAGIGCERHCPPEVLTELMDTTLFNHGLEQRALHAIASIELKRNETGLLALSRRRNIPIFFYSVSHLLDYTEHLTQKSELVFRATGCYGVAEAAALAHAERITGTAAELIIPKQKNTRATIAVARAYLDSDQP